MKVGGNFSVILGRRGMSIQVMRDRSVANINRYSPSSKPPLTSAEQVDALRLLEMQRHAL